MVIGTYLNSPQCTVGNNTEHSKGIVLSLIIHLLTENSKLCIIIPLWSGPKSNTLREQFKLRSANSVAYTNTLHTVYVLSWYASGNYLLAKWH